MARLGELLVAAGLLTTEQIEQALRAQVMWGARLGTNLVELHFIDLDDLSGMLARQHNLPAALGRHFEKGDAELQNQLAPELAEMFSCLPLCRVGARKDIVIASSSPLPPKALAKIAASLGVDPSTLIPSIAAELRIRYQLERAYKIQRSSRFMRSPGKTVPPFPEFLIEEASQDSEPDILLSTGAPAAIETTTETTIPIDVSDLILEPPPEPAPTLKQSKPRSKAKSKEPAKPAAAPVPPPVEPAIASAALLATLDELAADSEPSGVPTPVTEDNSSGRERRKYIRTIADSTEEEKAGALGRIAIRRVAVVVSPAPVTEGNTLGEATRAIRRAGDRDKVAELCIDTLFRFAQSCEAATLLVVRGQVATSWKGFCRSGAPQPEIAVPLDQASLVPRATRENQTMRAPAIELSPIDQLLLVSLGAQSGDLVVVPVSIAGQVMCAIAMVTESNAQTATAESIAAAAGAAFSRLIRDAAR